LISIGVPEKAKHLVEHLNFENGHKYLFVDPDNTLYDALDLNRGIQRTFFNIQTPYAFLRRLQEKDGMLDLIDVLSKWSNGKYQPTLSTNSSVDSSVLVFTS
jgi:hypothetical protein